MCMSGKWSGVCASPLGAEESFGVEGDAQRLGEVQVRVGEHRHLATRAVRLAPCTAQQLEGTHMRRRPQSTAT